MDKYIIGGWIILTVLITSAGYSEGGEEVKTDTFGAIYEEALLKEGVREISYEQFVKLRDSGDDHVLLDVLLPDSYKNGHIEGAKSFPIPTINKENAQKRLSKNSRIVVYCANFHCQASTSAAKALSGLGYKVLDYKGGLKEWEEKGNSLVK